MIVMIKNKMKTIIVKEIVDQGKRECNVSLKIYWVVPYFRKKLYYYMGQSSNFGLRPVTIRPFTAS